LIKIIFKFISILVIGLILITYSSYNIVNILIFEYKGIPTIGIVLKKTGYKNRSMEYKYTINKEAHIDSFYLKRWDFLELLKNRYLSEFYEEGNDISILVDSENYEHTFLSNKVYYKYFYSISFFVGLFFVIDYFYGVIKGNGQNHDVHE
jgi:hypothetical protein